MFRAADVLLLNKIDLLPYVRFDRARYRTAAGATNPGVLSFEISATRGDGLEAWYAWLRGAVEQPWGMATS
jgi:hydrogenase nickel incorporation protein HypB